MRNYCQDYHVGYDIEELIYEYSKGNLPKQRMKISDLIIYYQIL